MDSVISNGDYVIKNDTIEISIQVHYEPADISEKLFFCYFTVTNNNDTYTMTPTKAEIELTNEAEKEYTITATMQKQTGATSYALSINEYSIKSQISLQEILNDIITRIDFLELKARK